MKNRSLIKRALTAVLLMGFSISLTFAQCNDPPPKLWGNANWPAYADWCINCKKGTPNKARQSCDPPYGTNRGIDSSTPTYDWEAELELQRWQQRQEQLRIERERKQRDLENAAIETRKREQARRFQFEEDKKDALNLLKSGAGQLGLKGTYGGDLKLKSSGQTTLKLKEPLFSKGSQGSAPPYLGNLDSKWPIVVDLKKVQGGTPQALRSANLKTHILLKALENYPNDWEGSI